MIDELRAIAIFSETVRLGSFRRAAKALDLSPSVVSYHVAQLEARCGCALLYRSTRKLSLTSEGEVLYQHAQDMLASAEAGLGSITANSLKPSGKLKLALPSVLSRSFLSRWIAEFATAFPGIELIINSTDERQNIIESGLDIAIRVGVLEDSTMKAKRLFSIRRKLVCAAAYLKTKVAPSQPEELSQWDWISLSMLPTHRTLRHTSGKRIDLNYEKQTTVNSVELMTELCSHGLGLSTPPDFLVANGLRDGSLVEILPDWHVEPIATYAVWPDNTSTNSNAMRFLSFINERIEAAGI